MVLSAACCTPLWAQPPSGSNIYTCIDASGVRITSDRLIPQCQDREQRVLGPSGVVRQRIGPAMTEAEMAQHLEVRRQQQLAQQREKEKRKEQQRRVRCCWRAIRTEQPTTHSAARACSSWRHCWPGHASGWRSCSSRSANCSRNWSSTPKTRPRRLHA